MVNILLSNYHFHEDWISNKIEWKHAYSRDYGKYYGEVVEPFLEYGIEEDNIIWLNYFEDSDTEMKRIVESSRKRILII